MNLDFIGTKQNIKATIYLVTYLKHSKYVFHIRDKDYFWKEKMTFYNEHKGVLILKSVAYL